MSRSGSSFPAASRLGVNIDHVATLRQLRGTPYPSLVEAARIVEEAGGEQITIHLREDRRHIQDHDVTDLRKSLKVPMNLEMAATDAMVKIATKIKPEWVCLVPEKRTEVTTEGGLDLKKNRSRLAKNIEKLKKAKIKVSLFVEPTVSVVSLSHELGADAIELHTGQYCLATQGALGKKSASRVEPEFERIEKSARHGVELGLHVHAGHGFDYENVRAVAALEREDRSALIEEFNIGHAIVCRAALVGMDRAVREMIASIRAP